MAVMDLVPECRVAADLGTGDGRLAVALVKAGRAARVIAADRKAGPLEVAYQQARKAAVHDRVELRLGDGLEVLVPGEAEVIIIAGIGGQTIAGMLERGKQVAWRCRRLVVQPLKDPSWVRRWLRRHRLGTVSETLALEAGRYYHVLAAEPGTVPAALVPGLGLLNDELGSRLITSGHPFLPKLIAQKRAECEKVLANLERAGDTGGARRRWWERRKARLEEAERCWRLSVR